MKTRPATAALLEDPGLVGSALSRAWTDAIDAWLGEIFDDIGADFPGRFALAATGGYGRRTLCPQSDLDLLLIHDGETGVEELADRVWYPLWDSGFKIGHAVRTHDEALDLARTDMDAATSILDMRTLGGDSSLVDGLLNAARQQWEEHADHFIPELVRWTTSRHDAMGDVAFLLEPDLKMARGGLRDVHTLHWLEVARPTLELSEKIGLAGPFDTLLSARAELHRLTGRPGDRLLLEEQDGVAAALGYSDADDLMAAIASAARTVGWIAGAALHRATLPRLRRFRLSRKDRVDLGFGLVVDRGQLELTNHADLDTDAMLPLRAAYEAADHGAFIGRSTLDQLADSPARLPDPWPHAARDLFVATLAFGRPAIPAFEALDQVDLISRLIPEWTPNRSRPQRNVYHRFTVDRHLLEAASEAALLTHRVARPDLLLLGALFHDIGKGYPGDHSEVGIGLVRRIATRMGHVETDVEVLEQLVKLHLLLPDVASRRDLEDEGTIAFVAEQVVSVETLELLAALTEADSIATGPSAWGSWKAQLVSDLVERTTALLQDGDTHRAEPAGFPSAEHRALLANRETSIDLSGTELTVVCVDRHGAFSRVAGALALHDVVILDANVHTENGMAVVVLRLAGTSVALREHPEKIERDVDLALRGRLALQARLNDRARTYRARRLTTARPAAPQVTADNRVSTSSTVLDVRCPDSVGLLYRITRAMGELDLDIVSARIQTMENDVVDSFYLRDGTGSKVTDPKHLREVELAVLSAIDASFAASEIRASLSRR